MQRLFQYLNIFHLNKYLRGSAKALPIEFDQISQHHNVNPASHFQHDGGDI